MGLFTRKTTFSLNVRKGKIVASKDFGRPKGLRATLQRNPKTGGTLVHSFIVDKKDFTRKGNKLIPKTVRGRKERSSLLKQKGINARVKIYL